jgi:hypothetical protein
MTAKCAFAAIEIDAGIAARAFPDQDVFGAFPQTITATGAGILKNCFIKRPWRTNRAAPVTQAHTHKLPTVEVSRSFFSG